MESPRPSSATAPSIWYAAVATPQRNPSGKRGMASLSARLSPRDRSPATRPAGWPGRGRLRGCCTRAGTAGSAGETTTMRYESSVTSLSWIPSSTRSGWAREPGRRVAGEAAGRGGGRVRPQRAGRRADPGQGRAGGGRHRGRARAAGGGCRTSELTLPGYAHDVCSTVHPLAAASPFFPSIDLAARGARLVAPPVAFAHPLDGGRAAAVSGSVADTAAALGADARAYTRLMGPLVRDAEPIDGAFLAPLRRFPDAPVGGRPVRRRGPAARDACWPGGCTPRRAGRCWPGWPGTRCCR